MHKLPVSFRAIVYPPVAKEIKSRKQLITQYIKIEELSIVLSELQQ